MATPLGHGLVGAALYLAFSRADRPANDWKTAVVCALSAGAADLDFLAGAALGEWNRFHQGVSHSLVVALAFGLVMARLPIKSLGSWMRRVGVFSMLYASHLVLDIFTEDARPPYGVPVLWPFWTGHVHAPFHLFPTVRRETVALILSPANWVGAAVEILVLGVLLAGAALYRRRRQP